MIFDIIVIAALLISCLIAFLRGFIREVLTIIGVLGGAAAAVLVGPKVAPVVKAWLDHHKKKAEVSGDATAQAHAHADRLFGILPYDMAADAIAYGGIFVVVVIILSIVSHLLSGWAKKIGLSAVDRTLGVLFGIARAMVLLALPYYAVAAVTGKATMDKWFEGSHTRPYVAMTADAIGGMLPKSVSADLNKAADKAAAKGEATMENATREKLEQMNVLNAHLQAKSEEAGKDLQQRNDQAVATLKEKAAETGDALKAGAATVQDRLHNAGEALKGQPAYSSHAGSQPSQPAYDSSQRNGLDGLMRRESK